MNKKYEIFFLIIISIVVLSTSTIGNTAESKKPNIILIICDSMRPDHLSAYGYKRKTSPYIDHLAKEGVLFTQAIAQGSRTLVSVPSLITSTYPHIHGVSSPEKVISSELSTLNTVLKKEGYRTLVITNKAFFLYFTRSIVDFDVVENYIGEEARVVADEAIKYLEQKAIKETPFFLWIYFYEPHYPYNSPFPYNKMYKGDKFYNPDKHIPIAEVKNSPDVPGRISLYVAEDGITEVDHYIAKYDGAITYVDSQIGRILTALKAKGVYHNTLIVLSSDHGEALGEHNYYFCHPTDLLYDEVIRIPLIFYFPDPDKDIRATEISTPVQSIDIAPTILDFLGIEPPESFRGKSLLPLLKGRRDKEAHMGFTISEGASKIAIRTDEWKLIYNGGDTMDIKSYELYNLRNDPLEADNLILGKKEIFLDLRQYVIPLKKEAEKYREKHKKESINVKEYKKEIIDKGVNEGRFPLSEDIKEMLRSLGYLQ